MSKETGQSLEERLDAVRQDLAFAHLIDIVEGREIRADAMLRAEAEQDMLHILNERDASPARSIKPTGMGSQARRFPRLWSLIALACLTATMAWLTGTAYPVLKVIFGF